MRLALRLSLVALALATSLGGLAPVARTACAGPTIAVRPKSVMPGQEITVVGEHWASGCNDVISCSVGCFGESCVGGEPTPPVQNLVLTLVPVRDRGTETVLAGDVDAEEDLRFRVVALIPTDLEPGRYVVTAANAAGHGAKAHRVTTIEPGEHG